MGVSGNCRTELATYRGNVLPKEMSFCCLAEHKYALNRKLKIHLSRSLHFIPFMLMLQFMDVPGVQACTGIWPCHTKMLSSGSLITKANGELLTFVYYVLESMYVSNFP